MFNEGMAFVKLCDLPKLNNYVIVDGRLWVAATQWGDHAFVGHHAREELIQALEKRPKIEQERRDLRQ